jgi:hypothetical protein
MSLNDCPHEASLLAALAQGSIPDELNQHLSSCAVCRDAHLVWTYLHDSAPADSQADLPSPGVIWWRAQLAKKRSAAQRSVVAITVMQTIALAAAMIGVVAIAIWQSPKLLEVPSIVLAGTAAILLVLIASVIVVLTSARQSHGRTSARGM